MGVAENPKKKEAAGEKIHLFQKRGVGKEYQAWGEGGGYVIIL